MHSAILPELIPEKMTSCVKGFGNLSRYPRISESVALMHPSVFQQR